MNIPIVSLKDSNEEIARKIYESCTQIGFFYIIDHGLEKYASHMFHCSKEFFELDLETKLKILNDASSKNRGYTSLNGELLSNNFEDCKECFNVLSPDTDTGEYWPPAELLHKGFKEEVQEFYLMMHDLAIKLLGYLERAFKKPNGFFSDSHQKHGPTTLRFLKYPTQIYERNGAGPHRYVKFITDKNYIVVIMAL